MGLSEQIKKDLEQAIRQRDTIRSTTLRMLMSSIQNAEIDQQHKALDDAGIAGVVAKEIKKRRESIEAFEKGNRPDLVDKEKTELNILSPYLPQQMSRDEIVDIAKKVIAEVAPNGPGDKGKVMSKLMPQTKGKADGKEVSDIVTELLSNL
jgi:uncharacterized protein YqeY